MKNETVAQERLELLAGLARRLRDAGREDLIEEMVDRAASAEGRALDEILRTADLIVAGKLAGIPKEPAPMPTIRQRGGQWTSGELHRLYPDHFKLKGTSDDGAGRFELYVYRSLAKFRLTHLHTTMRISQWLAFQRTLRLRRVDT